MVRVETIVKVEGRLRIHTETKNQINQQFLEYLQNFFAGKVGNITDYYVVVYPYNIQVPMKVTELNTGTDSLTIKLQGIFQQQVTSSLTFDLYGIYSGGEVLIASVQNFTLPQQLVQTTEVLIEWSLIFNIQSKTYNILKDVSVVPPSNTISSIIQLLEISLVPYESYYSSSYTQSPPTATISPQPPGTIINITGTTITIIFYPYALSSQIINFSVSITFDGISFGNAYIFGVVPNPELVLGFTFSIVFTS